MSRQPNERKTSYIPRRRWMIRVKSLDETTTVFDNLMLDCLLDCSNIRNDEKSLIQTVCLNMTDFEMIATALRKQHADSHKSECWSKHEEDRPRTYRIFTSSLGTSRPHFRKNPYSRAIKAAVDLDEEDWSPDDDGGDSESDSYACVSL